MQFSSTTPPLKRPLIYGSSAAHIGPGDPPASDPTHSHRWTVYVRGLHGEDISYFIEKVEFKLHESFANSIRVLRSPPFEVTETGWGEFAIGITVWLIDPKERPIQLSHMLQLYHKDKNPLNVDRVISEHYDELEFNTPSVDLQDALLAHPYDSLPKPLPSAMFNQDAQDQEQKMLQAGHSKILAEYEIIKQKLPDLEQELRDAYDELKVVR